MIKPDYIVAISARIVTDKELTMNAKGVAIRLYDLANAYASSGNEDVPITVDSENNVVELFTRRTK